MPVRRLDVAVNALATRQHGVVSHVQLRRLGLTARGIEHRVSTGRLVPLWRGVYAVGHAAVTEPGRVLAAVLAIGEDAVAAGTSALGLLGVRAVRPGEDVRVLVPREVGSRPGLRVHGTDHLPSEDITRVLGVPSVVCDLALLQAAAVLRPREARRAVGQALVLRRTSVPQLVTRMASSRGKRGVRVLARAMADGQPTRSELEDALVALLHTLPIPPFETNVRVAGMEVDVLIAEAGLVIEADGRDFHETPIARADDAARDRRLHDLGLRVLRVRWRDVTVGHATTAERVLAAVAQRSGT